MDFLIEFMAAIGILSTIAIILVTIFTKPENSVSNLKTEIERLRTVLEVKDSEIHNYQNKLAKALDREHENVGYALKELEELQKAFSSVYYDRVNDSIILLDNLERLGEL